MEKLKLASAVVKNMIDIVEKDITNKDASFLKVQKSSTNRSYRGKKTKIKYMNHSSIGNELKQMTLKSHSLKENTFQEFSKNTPPRGITWVQKTKGSLNTPPPKHANEGAQKKLPRVFEFQD